MGHESMWFHGRLSVIKTGLDVRGAKFRAGRQKEGADDA